MSAHPLPAGNPRPTEDALRWQLDRLGSTAWEGWDLKFQRMAYGFAEDSGPFCARETLLWHQNRDAVHDGIPARGKLVWYANGRISVMCGLGNGMAIGPGVHGTIGVIHHRDRDGYVGWTEPIFPYIN